MKTTETVGIYPGKEVHVMHNSDILANVTQTRNYLQIAFEYEQPKRIETEMVAGEHGPYLVLKAIYE